MEIMLKIEMRFNNRKKSRNQLIIYIQVNEREENPDSRTSEGRSDIELTIEIPSIGQWVKCRGILGSLCQLNRHAH